MACKAYFGESPNQSDEIEFEIQSNEHANRDKLPAHNNRNYSYNLRTNANRAYNSAFPTALIFSIY